MGVPIWSNLVTFLSTLTGTERLPIASAPGAIKQSTNINAIANYVNGNAQQYTTLIPVTLDSTNTQNYTGTGNPTQTSYSTTKLYVVPINYTNINASATLNINTIAQKSIFKNVSGVKTPLVNGDLTAGQTYIFYYDGTDFVIFNGKINTFYDNDGNLMIVALNLKYYFVQPPSTLLGTSNTEILIRDSTTRELRSVGTQQALSLYLHPSGTDVDFLKENPIAPYATLQKANTYVTNNVDNREFSTVFIKNGVFNETVNTTPFLIGENYVIEKGGLYSNEIWSSYTDSTNIFLYGEGQLRCNLYYTNSNVILTTKVYSGGLINVTGGLLYINTDIIQVSGGGIPIICSITNARFNIKCSQFSKRSVDGTGGVRLININGGSGFLKVDELLGLTDGVDISENPLLTIQGACANIYCKLGVVGYNPTTFPFVRSDIPRNYAESTFVKTRNVINVSNSSGTVEIEADTIYGTVILAPTGTGKVILRVGNKIIANVSGGDTLTMSAGCTFTGIAQNESTAVNSTALKLTASNACVKDAILQGGATSVNSSSPYNLIVAGTLSTEVAKGSNVTIIGGTYTQNSNFSNF